MPDTTKCSTADKPADCNYPNCACGDPPKNQNNCGNASCSCATGSCGCKKGECKC